MTLRYLALGDSYSIGEGVPESGCWPVQLAQALRAEGIALAAPQIIATTGWTTDELDAGIDAANPQGPFALVTLLIGVNNQYRGRSLNEYRAQFSSLLERAIGFADGQARRVLVLSIPDWGVTPFARASGRDVDAIGREIDAFNTIAAEVCSERGIGFVDITPYSRAHGHEVQMLVDDALHPSTTMYAGWTALTLPEARRAVSSR